ncbi:MAG TPA: hypothetical protein VKV24_17555 [Casimicrobiaceae bacterium]|nr:hypothetical protein [Casimicrobiaceae bacterium]
MLPDALYFNPKAFGALVRELRRASWAMAIAIVAPGITGVEWAPQWLITAGAVSWVLLQCMALALEPLEGGKDKP